MRFLGSTQPPAFVVSVAILLLAGLASRGASAQDFEVLDDFEGSTFDAIDTWEWPVRSSGSVAAINSVDQSTNPGKVTVSFGPKGSVTSFLWKDVDVWLDDVSEFAQIDVTNFATTDDERTGETAAGLILQNDTLEARFNRENQLWFWIRASGQVRVRGHNGQGKKYYERTEVIDGYQPGDLVTLRTLRTGTQTYEFFYSHQGGDFISMGPDAIHPMDDPLDIAPTAPGFMTGFATGFTCAFDNFGVGTATPFPDPSNLQCTRDDTNVDLTWENHDTYDSVSVQRDDEEPVVLAGTATSFQDTNVPPGPHTYSVVAVIDDGSGELECTVQDIVNQPPSDLSCSRSPDGTMASLSWTNNGDYVDITVFRTDVVGNVTAFDLADDDEMFEDTGLPIRIVRYEVEAQIGSSTPPGPTCVVEDPQNPEPVPMPVVLDNFEADTFNSHGMWEGPVQITGKADAINEVDHVEGLLRINFGPVTGRTSWVWRDEDVWLTQVGDFVQVDLINDNFSTLGLGPGLHIQDGLDPLETSPGTGVRRGNSFSYWLVMESNLPCDLDPDPDPRMAFVRVNGYRGRDFRPNPPGDQYVELSNRTDPFEIECGDKVTLRVLKTDERVYQFSFSHEGGPFEVIGSATHPLDGVPGDPDDDPNTADVFPVTPGILAGEGATEPVDVFFGNFASGRILIDFARPTDLVCNRESTDISLTWLNNDADYEAIKIERDGEAIATISGQDTSFPDMNVPPGSHTYRVLAVLGGFEGGPNCVVEDTFNLPPSDLTCSRSQDGTTADLTWTNNGIYAALKVVRRNLYGDVQETAVGPTDTSFQDSGLPSRLVSYEVVPQIGMATADGPICELEDPANPEPVRTVLDDFEEEEDFNVHGHWAEAIILQGSGPEQSVNSMEQMTEPGKLTVDFGGFGGSTLAYPWSDPDTWLTEIGRFVEVTVANFSPDGSGGAAPGLALIPSLDPPLVGGARRSNTYYFSLSSPGEVRVNAYNNSPPSLSDQFGELRQNLPTGPDGVVQGDEVILRMERTGEQTVQFQYKRKDDQNGDPGEFQLLGSITHPVVQGDPGQGIPDAVVPVIPALMLGLGTVQYVVTFDDFTAQTFTTVVRAFRRGDHDGSGAVDITDSLNRLAFLFLGTNPSTCKDASDYDNSGALDISDSLNELSFLFLGSNTPPSPGVDNCGPDPIVEIHDGNPDNRLDPGPDGLPLQPAISLGCDQYPDPTIAEAACP